MKYHISLDIELKKNPHAGKLIAIEGIDGSGKSTQVEKLKEHFKKSGRKVVITSEPNDKLVIGKLIRKILRSKVKVPPETLQYLYSADRVINHETIVIPALKSGAIVLSHRSFWSAIPYGIMDKTGEKYKLDESKQILIAQGILSMYHQFVAPDITFYLDLKAEVAVKRLAKMDKVKELYEKKEKLEKVVNGYKFIVKQFPDEFTIIDGHKESSRITKELIEKIESIM